MAESEPRTFRNWQAIAYYGIGLVGFALVFVVAVPPLWYASIPCALLLLAATRLHVIVYGTEIDHLSVLFSRGWHFGWRIRVHHGPSNVDTFASLNLAGFRFRSAAFCCSRQAHAGQRRG